MVFGGSFEFFSGTYQDEKWYEHFPCRGLKNHENVVKDRPKYFTHCPHKRHKANAPTTMSWDRIVALVAPVDTDMSEALTAAPRHRRTCLGTSREVEEDLSVTRQDQGENSC